MDSAPMTQQPFDDDGLLRFITGDRWLAYQEWPTNDHGYEAITAPDADGSVTVVRYNDQKDVGSRGDVTTFASIDEVTGVSAEFLSRARRNLVTGRRERPAPLRLDEDGVRWIPGDDAGPSICG
ncbi:hypothetical protein [Rugosimonospora africana]|uniref:Uncharacterized protein n=1 Tax=Rugosimonospora africana TaxID=556532 RepID=A0A8J3R2A7_9ACTN|nr:hypothetical protein [Rugosimonospora africana]GIH20222.1 hypothetical protein Raf01_83940 [Rugosimonospora africana]